MVRLIGERKGIPLRIAQFQFQNGSINSLAWMLFRSSSSFQFQNGSINSEQGADGRMELRGFQFQNGSINSHALDGVRLVVELVSIPKWFD